MLSQRTRYALKALLYLADHGKGHVAIGVIAEQTNVSRKFLEGILLEMKRDGLVESIRGKHGGYRLARLPAEISFGDVIRCTEGPLALVPCVSKNFYRRCADCVDEHSCVLRKVMATARDKVSEVLDETSLADALASPEALIGAGLRG